MLTLTQTDQMPATTHDSHFDFTLDTDTPASPAVPSPSRKGVKAMAWWNRPPRRVRVSADDRALERALLLEAVRRQRSMQRSVYEQVYRARMMR